jgi:hypothetical protein
MPSDRTITAVALDITTICNLRCPECVCAVSDRKPIHYPWAYFEALAPFLRGIERIDITGGEPTCHPHFAEFAYTFRELFGCKLLTLETNGFRALENIEAMGQFDLIRLSRYGGNDDVINWILAEFPSYVQNGSTCGEIHFEGADELGHIPRSRRGSGSPCNLGRCEFVACSDGRLFPCRVGPGISGAESMALCEGWREKILDVPLPCGDCCFSPD